MILIKNVEIVNPGVKLKGKYNIAIKHKKIIDVFASNIDKPEYKEFKQIDATNLIAVPSFVDIHTHLRDPGFEYKEDILSGAEAAKAGGFTDICCMANTNPVIDNIDTVKYIKEKAKNTDIDIYPIAAITKGLQGKEITEFGLLLESGAIAFSDDGVDVSDAQLLRIAFEYANFFNVPILCHCENKELVNNGVMNEGYWSTFGGLRGIPAVSEEINVYRNIKLAEFTNAKIHICHVSTRGSLEIIQYFKEVGVNVSCETAPHYLTLTDEDVIKSGYNPSYKMNPPLRTKKDKTVLLEGVRKDIIDCIATDHAPHAEHEKLVEFDYAPFGIIGLETAFTVCYSLVRKNKLKLEKLISKLTIEPAKIIGIKKDIIKKDSLADIVLLDLNKKKKYNKSIIKSKSSNSPYLDKTFQGWPVVTISKGKIVYSDI